MLARLNALSISSVTLLLLTVVRDRALRLPPTRRLRQSPLKS